MDRVGSTPPGSRPGRYRPRGVTFRSLEPPPGGRRLERDTPGRRGLRASGLLTGSRREVSGKNPVVPGVLGGGSRRGACPWPRGARRPDAWLVPAGEGHPGSVAVAVAVAGGGCRAAGSGAGVEGEPGAV